MTEMTERFTTPRPSPRDLAMRPRPATPTAPPAPAQVTAADGTWDRAAFEDSLRHSDLLAVPRLCGFLLASFADPATGRIPAERTPSVGALARSAGIDDRKARSSLNCLEHGGWMVRDRHPDNARPAAITLTSGRDTKRPDPYRH
ncbi:hypothetical protein AB0903_09185 [Streptomyces sp. NPDC048389]|uniref:hypothetical protein n=1 Tax=Streptomyces sp. NPDC048389 TaxID=3154622 RepID=UPI0034549AE2